MNPLLCSNASRDKAMDNLAHVTPRKFQKIDDTIQSQEHQQQMNSSQNHSVPKITIILYRKKLNKRWNWNLSQQ